jgi:hypothetical protein
VRTDTCSNLQCAALARVLNLELKSALLIVSQRLNKLTNLLNLRLAET